MSNDTKFSLPDQVNLLGELLGNLVGQHFSPQMLSLVEKLRQYCKAAEAAHDETAFDTLTQELTNLSAIDLEWLLRIYSLFFYVVNQAEIQEILHINHEREHLETLVKPRQESLLAAFVLLKQQGHTAEQVQTRLAALQLGFTLTAHPTEAKRQTVLRKLRRITELLASLAQTNTTALMREQIQTELKQILLVLLYTDHVRQSKLTVRDEVNNVLHYMQTTIWQAVVQIQHDVAYAYKAVFNQEINLDKPFIYYRSWVGGDADGNPFVSAKTAKETLELHQQAVLQNYIESLTTLQDFLSISQQKIVVPEILLQNLPVTSEGERHIIQEPFRRKIDSIIKQLKEVLSGSNTSYQAETFLTDLLLMQQSLKAMGLIELANNSLLSDLIIQVKTFKFYFAALDVRQNSEVHEKIMGEIFKKTKLAEDYVALTESEKVSLLKLAFKTLELPANADWSDNARNIIELFSVIKNSAQGSIGCYIISMTHDLSDILEVLLMARLTGLCHAEKDKIVCDIDIVPLFETIDDLNRIDVLLKAMFEDDLYQQHLHSRQKFQEVMLGYSDSSKDGGICAATILLRQVQEKVTAICDSYGINFRLFHGRGGSAGRGGIRLDQAILAMPADSVRDDFRVTEQGEVISFYYALPGMARRHYEQTLYAMLTVGTQTKAIENFNELLGTISVNSMQQYRTLIHDEKFWTWMQQITPIEYIGKLPIASRPVSRKAASQMDFSGLRAIPWVFSWTQNRYNLTAWFGAGAGLSSLVTKQLPELQYAYQYSIFFRLLIDNLQQELAKTHLPIAKRYAAFADDETLKNLVETDYQQAVTAVLAITQTQQLLANKPVLVKSIELRTPYTDVLNLLQLELMRRANQQPETINVLLPLLLQSISGIAAAIQTTG